MKGDFAEIHLIKLRTGNTGVAADLRRHRGAAPVLVLGGKKRFAGLGLGRKAAHCGSSNHGPMKI
jgi:hypothetical protein